MIFLEIPSPASRGFFIGPVEIRYYALFILAGIFLATWLGGRRFAARGGKSDKFDTTVLVTVLVGIVGARLYHVITDYELYFGPGRNPWQALNIRGGGLGIWGAVGLGAAALWFMCRRYRFDFGSFADVLAPGVLFAQGIGRLGNWFNQELFGQPTTLPWGLYIDPQFRPAGYEQYSTFHPTFLYELVWNTIGGFVLLWAERRFKLGRGKLFTAYVVWYTFGRFFVEALRIDPVNHVAGFRVNSYVSGIVFLAAVATLVWQLRRAPGVRAWPFGFSTPQGSLAPARPRAEQPVAD